VTGREVIEKCGGNGRIADAIEAMGYVCVPRIPTDEMIHQARYDALSEDARAVWETMVAVSDGKLTEDRTFG
jgi:hypothetical protein